MKKLSLFLIYFCVGLMASHTAAMAAGATTLRVGVPKPPTNSVPVSYESISTTQIDGTLSALTAQFPTQYQYPANFTQIEADKAFVELAGLKQDLDTQIFNVMLADPAIKSNG